MLHQIDRENAFKIFDDGRKVLVISESESYVIALSDLIPKDAIFLTDCDDPVEQVFEKSEETLELSQKNINRQIDTYLLQGKGIAETAQLIGCSPNTVRARWNQVK